MSPVGIPIRLPSLNPWPKFRSNSINAGSIAGLSCINAQTSAYLVVLLKQRESYSSTTQWKGKKIAQGSMTYSGGKKKCQKSGGEIRASPPPPTTASTGTTVTTATPTTTHNILKLTTHTRYDILWYQMFWQVLDASELQRHASLVQNSVKNIKEI